MKKEIGFTLIELLAVLVILAVIALIVTPIILSSIETSKEKAYEQQKRSIIEAARLWNIENTAMDRETYINVNSLREQGYLENREIINPINGTIMLGCVTITNQDDLYSFDYDENECAPVLVTNITLRTIDNLYMQWTVEGKEEWQTFATISSLLGSQGEKGDKGLKGNIGSMGNPGPPGFPGPERQDCP